MFVTFLAAAGLFMDRIESRRTPFLLCLLCLTGATALLAVGTNVGLWVAGRLLQGVSAGMLWVVCLALLTDTVGPAGIGQAVGVIGIPMSIGPIVGPLLGGVIYAHGGYYAVFGLMFAMLGMDAVLRLVMIEKRVAQKWLEAEAVQPDTPSVIEGTDSPASPTPFPECSDTSNTLPLVVNALFGWQQTGQGLIFIAILLPSLLQPVFGAISDRYQQGRRLLAASGCLLATPAYVLLRLVTQDTLGQKILLCALLVVIGLAMAIAMPAIIAEIGATVADAEKEDPRAIKRSVIATGWSLVNAAYAAGCLIGPLFAGLIRNAAGWQTTTWCLGLLSAFTGTFLLLCLGGWIGKLRPKAFIHRLPR